MKKLPNLLNEMSRGKPDIPSFDLDEQMCLISTIYLESQFCRKRKIEYIRKMFKKGAAVVSSKVEQGKAELPPPPPQKNCQKNCMQIWSRGATAVLLVELNSSYIGFALEEYNA